MIELSAKWAPLLLSQPETGMNFQIASVNLKDGRAFHHVYITGGYITKIGDSETIPFKENEIDNIIVDHGRSP
jgi:hypothetical protein